MKIVAYRGIPGTFSHEVARTYLPDCYQLACETSGKLFDSLSRGWAHYAVVPVKNNLAGKVGNHQYRIENNSRYKIVQRVDKQIDHFLVGRTEKSNITHVRSHWQALKQCKDYLKKLNVIKTYNSPTTAHAAAWVTNHPRQPEWAAICSYEAAVIYNLPIIQANIQDAFHNVTEFWIIERTTS